MSIYPTVLHLWDIRQLFLQTQVRRRVEKCQFFWTELEKCILFGQSWKIIGFKFRVGKIEYFLARVEKIYIFGPSWKFVSFQGQSWENDSFLAELWNFTLQSWKNHDFREKFQFYQFFPTLTLTSNFGKKWTSTT